MASTANNRRVFGQATRGRGNGPTRYQRQHAQGGRGQKQNQIEQTLTEEQELAQRRLAARARRKVEDEALDDLFGVSTFNRSSLEPKKRGWIYNILPTVRCSEVLVLSALFVLFFVKKKQCVDFNSTGQSVFKRFQWTRARRSGALLPRNRWFHI
jgi:hypothetical protein